MFILSLSPTMYIRYISIGSISKSLKLFHQTILYIINHIKYFIVYDACHHPYYYKSIYWLVNLKYLLKNMVLQKKVVFVLFRSFKNKAIASGILKKLQIFVKLRPFK